MMKHDSFKRERNLAEMFRENETYAKLEFVDSQVLFVKGTWYPTHFLLSVMDGQDTWDVNGISRINTSI